MDTNIKFKIHSGPSKERLFDALKYAHDQFSEVDLDFDIAESDTVSPGDPDRAHTRLDLQIRRLYSAKWVNDRIEDPLVEITGMCTVKFKLPTSDVKTGVILNLLFSALYDTEMRKGDITLYEWKK